jgi:uncharacterized membrane protein YhhN
MASRRWNPIGCSDLVLFPTSDSILAINKFKSPGPMAGYLIWATYYLAQYGIAIGFLREKLGGKQWQEG